jgi:hypothetical protein
MQSKKPLDFIMRQFHDAMEMLMEYEFDERFVPYAAHALSSHLRHHGPENAESGEGSSVTV